MSFSGIFSIGLSGLNAHTTSLEAVSDNIANSQTVGFRRARTDFSQLIAQQQSARNNIAGNGVNATNRHLINEQGFINRTQSSTDLAISGNGFFVVSQTPDGNPTTEPFLFTRAGDFRPDANGNLVNSAGYFLRGQAIGDDINNIGNLNSLQTVNINNITGAAVASTAIALNANFSVNAPLSSQAASYSPNDSFNNLTSGAITPDLQQTFTVFDQAGNDRAITLSFLRTGPNQIAVEAFDATSSSGTPLASGNLTLNANGRVDQNLSTFPANLNLGNGFSPISLDLNAITQTNSATRLISTNSNGAPTGTVTGFQVNSQGILNATLSNGQIQNLFQIPLALFTNAEGLNEAAATAFQFSPQAGDINLTVAGNGNAGRIESAALESSTVDISVEFSTLIETQRAYSASARILTVADDLLQTLNQTAL